MKQFIRTTTDNKPTLVAVSTPHAVDKPAPPTEVAPKLQLPPFRFNPLATLIFRSKESVQFGIDTAHTAVVTFPSHQLASSTVSYLKRFHSTRTYNELITGLAACGNSVEWARAFIEDLVAYRVIVPQRTKIEVAVVGTSPLAKEVRHLLPFDHCQLLTSLQTESEEHFLARVPEKAILVLVDTLIEAPVYSAAIRDSARTIVQGCILDGRGYVGPAMIDGDGPCPLCAELYHLDLDPRWRMLLTQNPVRRGSRDPLIVAETAARIISMTLKAAGVMVSPPGVGNFFHSPHTLLTPGQFEVVDPYDMTIDVRHMEPHPHCPECFARISGTPLEHPAGHPQIYPA